MEGGGGHANLRQEGGKTAILPDGSHPAGAVVTIERTAAAPAHRAADKAACRVPDISEENPVSALRRNIGSTKSRAATQAAPSTDRGEGVLISL